MSQGMKDLLAYMGSGVLVVLLVVVALAICGAALFGPTILALQLHQPGYYWLYLLSPLLLGGLGGAYFWFEDHA